MKDLLSLEVCKQLKAWGCDVESENYRSELGGRLFKEWQVKEAHADKVFEYYKTYDLRDIICDGDLARKFFGNYWIWLNENDRNDTEEILHLLQQNKQEAAEKYLLDNCIFNPNIKSK